MDPNFIDPLLMDMDPPVHGPAQPTSSMNERPQPMPAPDRPLPPTHFYSIEYPGYVRPTAVPTAIATLGGQHRLDRVFRRAGPSGGAGAGTGGAGGITSGVGAGSAAGGMGASVGGTSAGRASGGADGLLELALRPGNPFAHPIPGDVVPANNLLLKVTRRRRKRRGAQGEGEQEGEGQEVLGHYTAEVVGVLAKTARFRSMVDYQYLPDMRDPVAQLRTAMDTMDVEALCTYVIPPEPAGYPHPTPLPSTMTTTASASTGAGAGRGAPTPMDVDMDTDIDMNLDPLLRAISQLSKLSAGAPSPAEVQAVPEVETEAAPESVLGAGAKAEAEAERIPAVATPASTSALRLFPPPLFSRQTIPQGYNFKANTASMLSTTVDEETGEERKRMINKMRWKGYGPASIMFADTQVPDCPPQAVQDGRHQISETILKKLETLFIQRPVWTRMSLFSQFSAGEARDILNSKLLLPLCCYVFQDGPWRDTLVRFSYDPRKDPGSRFYQRLYFRNANHPISRPSVTTRRQDRSAQNEQLRMQAQDTERRNAHIFDGQTITKETAAFQLCDITDPMLKAMIENPDALRETCNERDGWYTTHAFEQIKTVLRHKFFALLEGHQATDAECAALLAQSEGGGGGSVKTALAHRSAKLRAGKHNMAKGALRPEDAAALRLRATLDRSMKSFSSQR